MRERERECRPCVCVCVCVCERERERMPPMYVCVSEREREGDRGVLADAEACCHNDNLEISGTDL